LSIDVMSLDLLIVPINLNNTHWVCAALWLQEKRIDYYDSLNGCHGAELCNALIRYVHDEMQQKHPNSMGEFDINSWSVNIRNGIIHQDNGYDCGVFICMYADYIIRNIDPRESPDEQRNQDMVNQHIEDYRKYILLQIVKHNRNKVSNFDVTRETCTFT
jgi:sentrin-specific protease 1